MRKLFYVFVLVISVGFVASCTADETSEEQLYEQSNDKDDEVDKD